MLLLTLLLTPAVTILALLGFSKSKYDNIIRLFSLYSSMFSFFLSLLILVFFDKLTTKFQFLFETSRLFPDTVLFGVDGISLFFLILTTFITVLCVLLTWRRTNNVKSFLIYIFLIEFFLLLVFSVLDILLFYMFFESVLMPMFIMIGVWGSTYLGRVKASYFFFLYTLLGSTLMLIAIILIVLETGTTNLLILANVNWSLEKELILWVFTFIGFAVKIPMMPVHIWLPEAHVEAPTEGSVILASLLLKLGGYGFYRVSIPLFTEGSTFFAPFVMSLGLIGVVYGSLTTLYQIDLKKIIAYSSVAHMNLTVVGVFSLNHYGLQGSVFMMLGHGIISSGLFFLVGVLYDRHHTRSVFYYGGLAQVMPLYGVMLLFFMLGNMSFPGTCNFIGELLILVGIFKAFPLVAVLSATGVVFSAAYSIFVFNRIVFTNVKYQYISKYKDITRLEFMVLLPLVFFGIVLGILPEFVLDYTYLSVKFLTI